MGRLHEFEIAPRNDEPRRGTVGFPAGTEAGSESAVRPAVPGGTNDNYQPKSRTRLIL